MRFVMVPRELLEALTGDDECWFDHHGACQAHGFLSLQPGERCPHAEARDLLHQTIGNSTQVGCR